MSAPLRRELALDYDTALQKVPPALQSQGFGVLTEIDIKATLKKKLDVDFRRYTILGACNPPLAHKALSADLDVGLLLPCNVVVYEDGPGRTVVQAVDPHDMLPTGSSQALCEVADAARQKLAAALESL